MQEEERDTVEMEQMNSCGLDTFTPQHWELYIRLCLFSHKPFAQAQYKRFEMFADWLILFSYSEWIVINASFPLLSRACSPGGKTT